MKCLEEEISQETKIEEKDEEIQKEKSDKEPEITLESLCDIQVQGKIEYINGDATFPLAKGNRLIAHICNDIGGWGKGFVKAISKKWKEPEKQYRSWHRNRAKNDFGLGAIQIIQVEKFIWVAQRGIAKLGQKSSQGPCIRYNAVSSCLEKLELEVKKLGVSVHMPKIGTGLAGGDWNIIERLIVKYLCDKGIQVCVYLKE